MTDSPLTETIFGGEPRDEREALLFQKRDVKAASRAALEGLLQAAMDQGATERFERLAAEFYKATGIMAPGKDDCLGRHSYEHRVASWQQWLADRGRAFDVEARND